MSDKLLELVIDSQAPCKPHGGLQRAIDNLHVKWYNMTIHNIGGSA